MSDAHSRYAGVGTESLAAPGGGEVPYLRRRLLPPLDSAAPMRLHVVRQDERADAIAAVELRNAELSWVLADVNPVMRPSELERPGHAVRIPGPAG